MVAPSLLTSVCFIPFSPKCNPVPLAKELPGDRFKTYFKHVLGPCVEHLNQSGANSQAFKIHSAVTFAFCGWRHAATSSKAEILWWHFLILPTQRAKEEAMIILGMCLCQRWISGTLDSIVLFWL